MTNLIIIKIIAVVHILLLGERWDQFVLHTALLIIPMGILYIHYSYDNYLIPDGTTLFYLYMLNTDYAIGYISFILEYMYGGTTCYSGDTRCR